MREYNDYVRTLKRWLREYNSFKSIVQGLEADIAAQQEILDKSLDLSAPIAKYDAMPRGGTPELNGVEAAAQDRIRREQAIKQAIINRDEVQRIIDRIDRGINSLTLDEQSIIKDYYFNGKSWECIGYTRHYTERWARDRGNKILKKLAFIIFGIKAAPEQLQFVFIA